MTSRSTILINTSHYIGGNTYIYKFPSAVVLSNCTVCLDKLAIYNSTYNVTALTGNNTFTISWLGVDYACTIPDGYYTIDQLNDFVQQQCLIKGLFCIATTGSKYVYFFNFSANAVRYKAQIDCGVIPTASQATSLGFTVGTGGTWIFPTTAVTPTITLCSGLCKLFGFKTQSTFPTTPSTSNVSFMSDTYPTLALVFCYLFTCNLISSNMNIVPDLFLQVPLMNGFGDLMTVNGSSSSILDVKSGAYSEVRIQLYDQNLNPLVIQDPEMALSLILQTN